ncbi:MAG: lipopolysaccharide biosynthesis protein [Nocardioides sp.]|uniref:lipopolysaccharide biosynthesis protein n=1 Tax=Nocardioides sp. TaxID=35761 RepID=UPI003EFEB57C
MPSRRVPSLVSSGGVIAVAMAVMNVAAYAFTMIAAFLMGSERYGAFASVMNLLLVFSVASLGVQATAARRIASEPEHVASIEASLFVLMRKVLLPLGLLLVVLAPLVQRLLRLDSVAPVVIAALATIPLTLMGAQAGILQGERRWGPLALVYLAAGVPRLVIGTAILLVQPTETWAIVGVALGMVVPTLVGAWALRGRAHAPADPAHHSVRSLITETAHNSQALLAFFALSNVDLIVARNVVDAHEAGLYASGLILTKAMVFLPQFVVVVAFPAMSTPAQRLRALARGLGAIAALGVLGTGAAWLLSDVALVFIGGQAYAEVKPTLWAFALIGTALSMLQLLIYSALAQQSARASIAMWVGLVVMVALGLRTDDFASLALVVLTVDAVLLVPLLWLAVRSGAPAPTTDQPADEALSGR